MALNKDLIQEVNQMSVSELQVSYFPKIKMADRPVITKSKDAYDIFISKWDMGTIYLTESSQMLLLNSASRVLAIKIISLGGVSGTVVDVRVVLKYAILTGATAVMLAHNHPSGRLEPSQNDLAVTQKIKTAFSFHDMRLMDHLILMPEGYYSMADDGIL